MKRLTFGTPEKLTPSIYCKGFSYEETEISYPVDKIEFFENARGCCLRLPLANDEQIYGMGLQLKIFNLRGRKIVARPNCDPVAPTGDSHAAVPFFVSTAGYGIYVDTARHAEFYFGSSNLMADRGEAAERKGIAMSTDELYQAALNGVSNISIQIPAAKGVDIYIIEGKTITEIVSKYNMMSGGGIEVDEQDMMPIYRVCGKFNRAQVEAFAEQFRKDDLPIGTIGLEPGWHTRAYSCTYVFSDERFPEHETLIQKLHDMGYRVNLWEHAFVHPDSPIYKDILPYSGDYAVWRGAVPDFSFPEARRIFAEHHRKHLIEKGIDGFKLDECDGSDYSSSWSFPCMAQFPSGLDGEQYHALIGNLYMQAILESFGDRKPALSSVRSAGALSSALPFVLYSDLYGHEDFIRGVATAGFGGVLWTPEVRKAKDKAELIRRLQSVVFSAQCLINAWYIEEEPWRNLDCLDEVRELLKLRESLVPMLVKAFKKYKETGCPPIRALVSDYTNDPETYRIDNEYIFCDDLIVAPIAVGKTGREVYLPEGKWRDFFTKEPVQCGKFTVETDSIPVYEKAE